MVRFEYHIRRHKIAAAVVSVLQLMVVCGLLFPTPVSAELAELSDSELDNVTGRQGLSEFTIEDNTARIFFDMHIETYMEVDSLKLGYYDKTEAGGDFTTAKWDSAGNKTIDDNYAYVREYGNPTSNLYSGFQGDGVNQNDIDWDINWENMQLGKSETEPLIINGLIMKVEFDDINSSNKKLQKVVFGTNDMQGELTADMYRTTGMINPLTTTDSQARALGDVNPANGNPFLLKRDSFMANWNQQVYNASDHDTGFWITLNFGTGPDGETDHVGWEIISGYDERALDFSYQTGIDNVDLSGY